MRLNLLNVLSLISGLFMLIFIMTNLYSSTYVTFDELTTRNKQQQVNSHAMNFNTFESHDGISSRKDDVSSHDGVSSQQQNQIIYRRNSIVIPQKNIELLPKNFERNVDFHLLNNDVKDDKYFEKERHYNVDDYGVPLKEYILSVEMLQSKSQHERLKILRDRGIKTVLFMHSAYGSKTYGFNSEKTSDQGQWPYIMKGCIRKDCFCTDQRDFIPIDEFDAILFYSRAINPSDVPKVRKSHQRYILWEVEPPLYLMSFRPDRWSNFFNWTHTYRKDSDFWEPWGMINQYRKYPVPIDELIRNASKNTVLTSGKNKPIAWFVSNCSPKSGREKFVKELQKYIDVDIYGNCGTLKCSRNNHEECWRLVEKKYFFYYSAENSLCKDYITEKLFNALKYNIIPITFGGGLGTSDYSFMPKMSFINAFDYHSPRELAQYLRSLIIDRDRYASYFWWKPYYRVWLGRWKKAHCEICDQLHENKKSKTYSNIRKWWVDQAKCRKPWPAS